MLFEDEGEYLATSGIGLRTVLTRRACRSGQYISGEFVRLDRRFTTAELPSEG